MLINELSKKTGVTAHTIRFYEKLGLIKGTQKAEVKSNKYFHYDDESANKLKLIRDAKAAGFTLYEIKQLIDAWYNGQFSISQKITILDEKLVSIDEKIQQLNDVKNLIAELKNGIQEIDS